MDKPQQELIDNIYTELMNLVDTGRLDKPSAIKVSQILKDACEEFDIELSHKEFLDK